MNKRQGDLQQVWTLLTKRNLAPPENRITIPWTSHHMYCRVRKQVSAVSTTLLYFANSYHCKFRPFSNPRT